MTAKATGATPAGTSQAPDARVRITVADLVDKAIDGLKVEVRCAERIWYQGMTSAAGVIEFGAAQGRDLFINVQRWTNNEMKTVARFFTGKEAIDLKLVSPKVKVTSKGAAHGAPGAYQRGTYTVKAGDTLSSIARTAGVSANYLAQINGIRDANRIAVGQVLKMPPVPQRARSAQPHAPAPAQPPHRAPVTPGQPPQQARGATPQATTQTNANGSPVTTVQLGQAAVIFPLRIKPLNEPNGTYPAKNWRLADPRNAACFGRGRRQRNGGQRLHAGRDLYGPDFTEVVAVAPGKVLRVAPFYMRTNEVAVAHETSDGRRFIVRYGELDPATVAVKRGDVVTQGQLLGKMGILIESNGRRLNFGLGAVPVSMLHFELYSGSAGMETADDLSDSAVQPYQRRSDLIDGRALLEEGFLNTFREGGSTLRFPGDRKNQNSLSLSAAGLAFIKDYEKLRLDYYEDSEGYCTVGWGQLTGGKRSCASQGIRLGDRITHEIAERFLRDSCLKAEDLVKAAIRSNLYQHEFDALVSLAFNCGDIAKVAPSLCRKINANQHENAAAEFLDITNGGTKGLVIRRKQENLMFLTANYDSTH
jgi:GH24 family phage-related lysozyme (muramidase)/murein DD-endopeptidase MepM/ murein hydrolase activator NlpD